MLRKIKETYLKICLFIRHGVSACGLHSAVLLSPHVLPLWNTPHCMKSRRRGQAALADSGARLPGSRQSYSGMVAVSPSPSSSPHQQTQCPACGHLAAPQKMATRSEILTSMLQLKELSS